MSSHHVGLGVRLFRRGGACAGGRIGTMRNVDLPTSTSRSMISMRQYSTIRASTSVCGTIRLSGLSRYISPATLQQQRYNSSSPNTAKPASPALIASESRQPAEKDVKDNRSAFAKFRASLSLADQGNVTSEESATSGVKKLLNLARPEARQLGIAVGLVSWLFFFLLWVVEPHGNARGWKTAETRTCEMVRKSDLIPARRVEFRLDASSPDNR